MKRLILMVLFLGIAVSAFSQYSWSAPRTPEVVQPSQVLPSQVPPEMLEMLEELDLSVLHFATGSGDWDFIGSRLYQNAPDARLAKMNMQVPQSGSMLYEFNVRYEGGIEDGHGGFGIHLYADNVIHRASWGSGNSWLLWVNYDENPITEGIPPGFSFQVYRSTSQINMDLVLSFDLNEFVYLLTHENMAYPVPVRIWVNGETGEVRIYDPTDYYMEYYFIIDLPTRGVPLRGDWVSLRTNGLALSFDIGLGF